MRRRGLSWLILLIVSLVIYPAQAEQEMDPAPLLHLTEDTFQAGDVPEAYLQPCSQPGRIERVRYVTSDEEGQVKSAVVYLPAGYDEDDRRYNVLYLLHASGGKETNYLSTEKATSFQCLLDHMIQDGAIEPLIVVVPTYYTSNSFVQFMPLDMQVKETSSFPREIVEDVIPAVEGKYRTWAQTTDAEGLLSSRDHRAMAGFSLGGTITWYAFIQRMDAFRWFLPISEASWDDGEGGIGGIWDSNLSAEVLYNAVINQGFSKEDFYLFVATGTDDTAFEVSTQQMISLLAYSDLFIPGENTSCSMMINGTHTYSAIFTYLYHILPALFTLPATGD